MLTKVVDGVREKFDAQSELRTCFESVVEALGAQTQMLDFQNQLSVIKASMSRPSEAYYFGAGQPASAQQRREQQQHQPQERAHQGDHAHARPYGTESRPMGPLPLSYSDFGGP